jgi:hypothetical protein
MKTRIQIILLITGVVLFLALAGCGGSGDGPEVPPLTDTFFVGAKDTILEPIAPFLGKWELCAYGEDTTVTPRGTLSFGTSGMIFGFDYATQTSVTFRTKYHLNGVWLKRSYENRVDTIFIFTEDPLWRDKNGYAIGHMEFSIYPLDFDESFANYDIPAPHSCGCYFIGGRMYLQPSGGVIPFRPYIYKRIE